ncbi:MAG: hypothetical protein KY459_11360 [Acidobacteria bacterium]|nr:hypothetical protein [Acidobacteriota bacterium]
MSVQITIRDVPVDVKDELAARAAKRGWSMQEYLRSELVRIATRPAVETVLARIRERKTATGTRLDTERILQIRDDDRR